MIEPTDGWTGKLRGAWGRSGRAPDPFAKEFTFDINLGTYQGSQWLTQQARGLGNKQLKPELGSEIELGMEHYLGGDRAYVEANYFRQETKDAILPGKVPLIYGVSEDPLLNIGGLRSSGVELAGRLTALRRGETSLDLGVTLTHMFENGLITDLGDLTTGAGGDLEFIWNHHIGLEKADRVPPAAAPSGLRTGLLTFGVCSAILGAPREGAPHARSAAQRPVCGKNHRPAEEACR